VNIKTVTITRSVIEFKEGHLTPEEVATINVNVQRGHSIVSIGCTDGKSSITLEKVEEIK
jgi:hypothetical protein